MKELIICELCERAVEKTSRHHLIPRTLHSNKWFKKNFSREERETTVDLCRKCHRQIHRLIPEKEMGRHFNTLEKLRTHKQISHFLKWLRKKKL